VEGMAWSILHMVGLWQIGPPGDMLLASATVPAGTGGPLTASYRFVSIQPVSLTRDSAFSFRIGALYSANDPDDLVRPSFGSFAPGISALPGGRFAASPKLKMPTDSFTFPEGNGPIPYFHANFQVSVVPEPSTCLLFCTGVAGLCLLKRRCVISLGADDAAPERGLATLG
jgi:hypothetical protein